MQGEYVDWQMMLVMMLMNGNVDGDDYDDATADAEYSSGINVQGEYIDW